MGSLPVNCQLCYNLVCPSLPNKVPVSKTLSTEQLNGYTVGDQVVTCVDSSLEHVQHLLWNYRYCLNTNYASIPIIPQNEQYSEPQLSFAFSGPKLVQQSSSDKNNYSVCSACLNVLEELNDNVEKVEKLKQTIFQQVTRITAIRKVGAIKRSGRRELNSTEDCIGVGTNSELSFKGTSSGVKAIQRNLKFLMTVCEEISQPIEEAPIENIQTEATTCGKLLIY